jgi:glutamate/aspartate transport system substrate-binding protein
LGPCPGRHPPPQLPLSRYPAQRLPTSINAKAFIVKSVLIAVVVAASVVAGGAQGQGANTLGKIKAAKAINVAFSGDSLPFSFVGPNNEPAGYSIDICKRVIAQIGRAVGEPNLKINWMVGPVADRLAMVASGRADLECANTTQTLARLANVDFSNLIFIDGGGFLVKSDSPVNKVADMTGRKIAVLAGTTTETRLRDTFQRRLVNATIVPIANANEGVAMLESGGIDAYAGDKIKLVGLAAQAREPAKLALLAEDLSIEPYALAIPRNDSALRLEVNRALTQVYMGGEIEPIFAAWLGKLGRPSSLLTAMYLLYSIPD